MSDFVTYVLESDTSGRLYIGHTGDLGRRLYEHSTGQSKATRGRGPWRLLHAEPAPSRAEAMRVETWLKAQKSARSVRAWVGKRR